MCLQPPWEIINRTSSEIKVVPLSKSIKGNLEGENLFKEINSNETKTMEEEKMSPKSGPTDELSKNDGLPPELTPKIKLPLNYQISASPKFSRFETESSSLKNLICEIKPIPPGSTSSVSKYQEKIQLHIKNSNQLYISEELLLDDGIAMAYKVSL